MAMTLGGIARTVGLLILIIAAIASAAIDFSKGGSVWGWFKISVAVNVLVFELAYFIKRGKTISTKYKDFIMKHPFWGYFSLALFAIALAGLILHLAVW